MNRPPDAVIGAAATEVAGHCFRNLIVGGLRGFRQQGRGLHDLAHLAIPALRHIFGDPGLLQRMQPVCRQAFDGGDIFPDNLRNRSGTGTPRRAVHMNRAGTAQSGAAAELGARQLQGVAQDPEQWRVR